MEEWEAEERKKAGGISSHDLVENVILREALSEQLPVAHPSTSRAA